MTLADKILQALEGEKLISTYVMSTAREAVETTIEEHLRSPDLTIQTHQAVTALGFGTATCPVTLRDYFAAHAIPAASTVMILHLPEGIAKRAYEIADAMLAERVKKS